MCYGPCPVYAVTLRRTGQALYEGEHFVDLEGPYVALIDPAAFTDLALAAICLDYPALDPAYAVTYTDAATTTTWIVSDGERREVEDYGGAGPDRLHRLEELIDEAASELDWRPAGSPLGEIGPASAKAGGNHEDGGEAEHWTQRGARPRQ